ncbi:hypothetical protein [Desulfonema magnum]|uniref:Uncharacterized protein n=1 Tax=Desulfonema magnum TaxID=45655 RepID=A0A975GTH1_9BACT|nr:hypothetical protein [Desulfonema magnum]QTA92982.1 Uncharacterized protein dnm_090750 [Desulfonema magnum]
MSGSLAQAYVRQAKADFICYKLLKAGGQPASQWLHFLQMTLEKTGKAYLAAYGSDLEHLRRSHLAFGRFIRLLPRNRAIRKERKISPRQLKYHIDRILPLADKVERLAPALSEGPNAEYPWKNPAGQLMTPCIYDFRDILADLESVRGRNLLKIVERAILSITDLGEGRPSPVRAAYL